MYKEFIHSILKWGDKNNEIDSILLVGSYARNEAAPESDIDLVVIVNSKKVFTQGAQSAQRKI